MANFDEAYKLTGHNEGGYCNNPNDHGGETYAGIARNFWPAWTGWAIIDKAKKANKVPATINLFAKNAGIEPYVADFYKNNFWGVNKLDMISDQQIANNVYDFGVNHGVGGAAKFLQIAAGVSVDGIIGSQTIQAVNKMNAHTLYDAYNAERVAYYHREATAPGQLQFLKSWMSRIKPYVV